MILASGSPRRRELLESIGLTFRVVPSRVAEQRRPGEEVAEYVTRLSGEKARAVAGDHRDAWVIGSDTVVFLDDEILEKPASSDDAVAMLSRLAGREHTVFTGITLVNLSRDHEQTRVCSTGVSILPLSRGEIEWYVATGEPMDKAGAYAVQGIGAMFIRSVHGNYTNVVGLPLSILLEMMRAAGVDPIGNLSPVASRQSSTDHLR